MKQRTLQAAILCTLTPLIMTGCHIAFGPSEGEQEWWYFCDEYGCYLCSYDGCEIPDSYCFADEDCPGSLRCDRDRGICMVDMVCQMTADCDTGYVCLEGECRPGRSPCTSNELCGTGAYCSNGSCLPSELCNDDGDCADQGSNMVCDERLTCVPGEEPPVDSCASGSACAGGLCVDGTCGVCSGDCGGGKTCQFDAHCGEGRVCLDGQCTPSCNSDVDCGSGQTCNGTVCVAEAGGFCLAGVDCATSEVCVNNTCYPDCSASGECADSQDACSPAIGVGEELVRICQADHTARPQCQMNGDCDGGEVCVNGICRTSCLEDADCAACEDGPVCNLGFCMTGAEANPECSANDQCTDELVCLNSRCVSF